jgi:hypothetical protein
MDYATLNKLLPPVTDWPKFDGADDYNHISFIKYIDCILLSYNADDELVLCRLPRLFEGVALKWFITKQESLGEQSWSTWKQLIKAHFGTRVWEQKIRKAFESDYFDPINGVSRRRKGLIVCTKTPLNWTSMINCLISVRDTWSTK